MVIYTEKTKTSLENLKCKSLKRKYIYEPCSNFLKKMFLHHS